MMEWRLFEVLRQAEPKIRTAQLIGCVLAIGARVRPQPHLALVVEVEAIERDLGGQTRRGRGDVEALAAHAPSIAEVGVLMDMGLVEVDQLMPVALSGGQHRAQPRDEGLPPRGIGTAEQLLGLLPRQAEPVQGGADTLAAARAGESRSRKLLARSRARPESARGYEHEGRSGPSRAGLPLSGPNVHDQHATPSRTPPRRKIVIWQPPPPLQAL